MAALDADFVRGMAGGAGLILMYGLYAWRIFKSNPGDRFMESASVTLIIFVVVLASRRIPHVPDWVSNSSVLLLGISTFLSLFFMLQQGYLALRRRLTQQKSSTRAKRHSPLN
jgi:hypothetical protein